MWNKTERKKNRKDQHWLPFAYHDTVKMLMLTFKALNNLKSDYLGTTKLVLIRTAEEAFPALP